MKKYIVFGLIIVLVIFAVSSCSIFGVGTTMSDRIGSFEKDLNGSRSNIFDNIHPDANASKTLDDTYWEKGIWISAHKPFDISDISESSGSVTAVFTSGGYPGGTGIFFKMKDDGDFFAGEDWKIWSCTVNDINQF